MLNRGDIQFLAKTGRFLIFVGKNEALFEYKKKPRIYKFTAFFCKKDRLFVGKKEGLFDPKKKPELCKVPVFIFQRKTSFFGS